MRTQLKQVSFVSLMLVLACADPLPPETQWLAGTWQWVDSCCTIAGTGPVADSPDAFVVTLHENGVAQVTEHGVETLRTRFEVAAFPDDTLLRFDDDVFYAKQYLVIRSSGDHLTLVESPGRCADCLSRHGFVRAP